VWCVQSIEVDPVYSDFRDRIPRGGGQRVSLIFDVRLFNFKSSIYLSAGCMGADVIIKCVG